MTLYRVALRDEQDGHQGYASYPRRRDAGRTPEATEFTMRSKRAIGILTPRPPATDFSAPP